MHCCLSIKELEQNLVTEMMLKAWWYLQKSWLFLVIFIATLANVWFCICLLVFYLNWKQLVTYIDRCSRTNNNIFNIHNSQELLYYSHYSLMFRSRITHTQWLKWFSSVFVNCSNVTVQWQILKSKWAEIERYTVKAVVSCGQLFSYVLAFLFWWYSDKRYS